MKSRFSPNPDRKGELTTGMLASIWYIDQHNPHDEADMKSRPRLVEMEHRIKEARQKLQQIEKEAKEAEERINRAERKFDSLRDSFELLRSEWQQMNKNKKKKSD